MKHGSSRGEEINKCVLNTVAILFGLFSSAENEIGETMILVEFILDISLIISFHCL